MLTGMAYLRYGNYTHSQNEASVRIDKQSIDNDAGQQYAVEHTWAIDGKVHGDTTAAVWLAYTVLEAAYSADYFDAVLLDDDGNVVHALPNAGSLTGVRVRKPPSYPVGEGAELSTFRTYSIVLSAQYPSAGAANPLRSFSETLSFAGGGIRRTVVEIADGPPQEQVLSLYTAQRLTQQGQAVGSFGYPLVPPPLFPGFEEEESVPPGNPQYGSPKLRNGLYVDWPVSWAYRFISGRPLVGLPNRWPV
jgi:hypothetical protein